VYWVTPEDVPIPPAIESAIHTYQDSLRVFANGTVPVPVPYHDAVVVDSNSPDDDLLMGEIVEFVVAPADDQPTPDLVPDPTFTDEDWERYMAEVRKAMCEPYNRLNGPIAFTNNLSWMEDLMDRSKCPNTLLITIKE